MPRHNGFTLIEALITTLILVTGLAAIAGVFAYSFLQSSRVLRETAAIALMSSKIEELKTTEAIVPGRFTEYLVLLPNGMAVSTAPGLATYRRAWEITEEMPHRITVIVDGRITVRAGPFRELARATTLRGSTF